MKIEFELTGEMEQYGDDIKMFVKLMLHKLEKNTHKGRWENMSAVHAFRLLRLELVELETALIDNDKTEVLHEAADVANFAMIVAAIVKDGP